MTWEDILKNRRRNIKIPKRKDKKEVSTTFTPSAINLDRVNLQENRKRLEELRREVDEDKEQFPMMKRRLQAFKKTYEELEEEEFVKVSAEIPKLLENDFVDNYDPVSAFKLGYWYEKISPEIDLEKSYLWYSVSVSAGIYKAMKMRDRVGELIEKKKILEIQKEANDIFTKNKYFNSKKGLEE